MGYLRNPIYNIVKYLGIYLQALIFHPAQVHPCANEVAWRRREFGISMRSTTEDPVRTMDHSLTQVLSGLTWSGVYRE